MTGTVVGGIGSPRQARVDAHGAVQPLDAAWALDWWIGAEDRWHVAAREPTVRQTLVDSVPVVRTAMRVPGGDAVQHVYGTGGPSDLVMIEVTNDSPAPFVAALVVRDAHRLAVDGPTVLVDGRPALRSPRPAPRWAVTAGSTEATVRDGAASAGPFAARSDRAGRLEGAFLHPVAHRATLQVALTLGFTGPDAGASRPPGPAAAARGWRAHLDRGLHVELPDPQLVDELRAARAAALLAAARPPVDALVVAALEDWGFDPEAAGAWRRLGWRDRRRARRRPPGRWADVTAARAEGGAPLLLAARALLAHDGPDATVTVLPELPPAWRGQRLDVRGVPTRWGPCSYALRWHGARPALLWEAPPGVRLRAPGLDPTWASDDRAGEALLAAPVA